MKHHILFKILAVFLCAASLMGIVGGTAGALTLVEKDLYNKTVDQVLAQQVQEIATVAANQLASRYADQVLGGTPKEISRYSGPNILAHNFTNYGYAILDAEGNVLASMNPERKTNTNTHAIPVTGQYMHLVSLETETEKLARETANRMEAIGRMLQDQNGQTIPAEGIPVNQVIFTDNQGAPIYEAYSDAVNAYSTFYYSEDGSVRSSSRYDHEHQNQIGFLYYGIDGQLMYRSFLEDWDSNFLSADVCGVMFLSHSAEFLFQLEASEGLGTLQFENGYLLFTGNPEAKAVPVETQIAETVPETTAETFPTETTEATLPVEETQAEEENTEEYDEDTYEESEENKEEDSEEEESSDEEHEDSSASNEPEEDEYREEEHAEEEETTPAETEPPVTEAPETISEETIPEGTIPAETTSNIINGKPLESYQVNRTEYNNSITGEHTTARYIYLPMPELTVEIYVDQHDLSNTAIYNVLDMVRQYRSALLPIIGVCLLLFVLSAIYLFTAAGRSPKTEDIRAGGINRMPLDLYLVLGVLAGTALTALAMNGTPVLLRSDFMLGCSLAVFTAFLCCLMFTGFCFACVAQCKTGGGFWWQRLLCVRLLFLSIRSFRRLSIWIRETCSPRLKSLLQATYAKIRNLLYRLCKAIGTVSAKAGWRLNRFFSLMPLTWQWVVCGIGLLGLILIACNIHNALLSLLCLAAAFVLIFYGSHCFGLLLATARKMGKGDLDTKIESKLLMGSFRDFANDLNDLADAATVAAQSQLKSERMKTELITNVSHDIKTPLTSIINYVDLLQKPHTDEEEAEYLDVLDRQSQRLKKLVDDLMDMSKASTGNMTVEITRVDAVESVNQALGEFADKLERAWLYPVFRHSEDSVPMMADGKLVWRVLNNLLSNIVKYGMPGTRIYLDLSHVNGKVIISLKNISKEELNVTPEELMERFVRGDVSRNTEGSGLGLNIAKSLMELQNGSLQLLVDGDLFKVTLVFPDAK